MGISNTHTSEVDRNNYSAYLCDNAKDNSRICDKLAFHISNIYYYFYIYIDYFDNLETMK